MIGNLVTRVEVMDENIHEVLKRKAEVISYRKRRLLGLGKLLVALSILCYFDIKGQAALFFDPRACFHGPQRIVCFWTALATIVSTVLAVSGIADIVAHQAAKRSWQVVRLNPLRKFFLGVTLDDDETLKTATLLSPTKPPVKFSHLVSSPSVIFSTGFRNLFVTTPGGTTTTATNPSSVQAQTTSNGVDSGQVNLNQSTTIPGTSPIPGLKLVPPTPVQSSEVDRFIAAAAMTLSQKRPLTRQVSDSMLGGGDKRQRTTHEDSTTFFYSSSSAEDCSSPAKVSPIRRKKANAMKRRLSSGDISPDVNPYDSGCRTIKRMEVLEDFLERQREHASYDVLANQPLLSLFDSDTMGTYSVATRPAAEVSTISTLTSSPLVDEIWLSLHVSSSLLYEWTKRFRNWMSVTVLSPIASEVLALNRVFTESNLTDDLRFGHSSISAIRSSLDRCHAAGFSQSIFNRIELLCRFLDTDLHQSYVVTRIGELSRAGYLHGYSWNGPPSNVNTAAGNQLPVKDAQLLMDLFLNYMDAIQPKNSLFPEGRLFSRRYFVKAPSKPIDPLHIPKLGGSSNALNTALESPPMIQIYQPDESLPHFEIVLRGKRIQLRRSNSNLFHALLLFFYVIIKKPQLIEPPHRPQRRSLSTSKSDAAATPETTAAPSFDATLASMPMIPLLGPLRLDKAGLNLVSLFETPK